MMNLDFILVLAAPVAFAVTAFASWYQPGLRPHTVMKMGVASSVLSILAAAISGFFVAERGLLETSLAGIEGIGFSLRLDSLNVLMISMIAIIGFIVVRFSLNYLDGDERQGRFIGRLAATIASVQMLVLAGNLGLLLIAWILTSISLHRLLIFYKDRPGAIIAARKKFIMARVADTCLFAAIVLLYLQFKTGNLEVIFQAIKNGTVTGTTTNLEAAALFLALAAVFKSAQFPTHGWLIEVMETPTPVSALLHAGLLNAGPFLLIRLAYIMEASTYALLLIIIIGAFTALFGSIAYLTQTSVKTALGYSSVAHMGFSLMICGFGVYPAAMLHLIAHSFYKAHAFLSSGSVIDVVRASKIKIEKRIGNPFRIALGVAMAIGIYYGVARVWGMNLSEDLALLTVGVIMILGLSTIFTSALDAKAKPPLIFGVILLGVIVTATFFTLESGMHSLLTAQLPATATPGFMQFILAGIVVVSFTAVVAIQILAPILSPRPFYRAMAIHFRNGFYANVLFDRMVNAFRIQSYREDASSLEKTETGNGYVFMESQHLEEQTA